MISHDNYINTAISTIYSIFALDKISEVYSIIEKYGEMRLVCFSLFLGQLSSTKPYCSTISRFTGSNDVLSYFKH